MNTRHLAGLALLITTTTLVTPASVAQTISIPVSRQAEQMQDIERPKSGSKMSQVLKRFGQPLQKSAPVGEPPIERWDYAEFSVYFEYQRVIHSVLKHHPTN